MRWRSGLQGALGLHPSQLDETYAPPPAPALGSQEERAIIALISSLRMGGWVERMSVLGAGIASLHGVDGQKGWPWGS